MRLGRSRDKPSTRIGSVSRARERPARRAAASPALFEHLTQAAAGRGRSTAITPRHPTEGQRDHRAAPGSVARVILGSLEVDPQELAARTGWEVKPEGACKAD